MAVENGVPKFSGWTNGQEETRLKGEGPNQKKPFGLKAERRWRRSRRGVITNAQGKKKNWGKSQNQIRIKYRHMAKSRTGKRPNRWDGKGAWGKFLKKKTTERKTTAEHITKKKRNGPAEGAAIGKGKGAKGGAPKAQTKKGKNGPTLFSPTRGEIPQTEGEGKSLSKTDRT